MFKKSILTDKVAIELKTKEEVDNLCDWLEKEAGQEWGSGSRRLLLRSHPCICPSDRTYSTKLYSENEGYKVISYQEALKLSEDPRDNLKYGQVVEFDSGELCLVLPRASGEKCFVYKDGSLNTELALTTGLWEIVKIYNYNSEDYYTFFSEHKNLKAFLELVWEKDSRGAKLKELHDKMEEVKNRHNKELEEIQEELNSLKECRNNRR